MKESRRLVCSGRFALFVERRKNVYGAGQAESNC